MSGWLYERVAKQLAPYGLTPAEYVREMRQVGCGWSEIQGTLRADVENLPNARPNPATLKLWAEK